MRDAAGDWSCRLMPIIFAVIVFWMITGIVTLGYVLDRRAKEQAMLTACPTCGRPPLQESKTPAETR